MAPSSSTPRTTATTTTATTGTALVSRPPPALPPPTCREQARGSLASLNRAQSRGQGGQSDPPRTAPLDGQSVLGSEGTDQAHLMTPNSLTNRSEGPSPSLTIDPNTMVSVGLLPHRSPPQVPPPPLTGGLLLGASSFSSRAGLLYLALLVSLTSPSTHLAAAQFTTGSREYCQLETFVASCDPDEVIAMELAHYGRMRLGRCVKGDLGYIGCSADVLDVTDRKCSGRHRCEIRIPNEEFERTKPCYMELKSYFEAQYHCVKVATVDHTICRSCDSVKVTAQSGYIASVVTDESGCGSAFCPWILEGRAGQRINLTMLDFTAPSTPDVGAGDDCSQLNDYVFLKEDREGKSVGVCGGARRRKHVYTTLKNRVSITIGTAMQRQNKGHFLIYYEIIGCPDVEPADDAWFRREADGVTAVVGCVSSDQVWTLTCMGDNWLGEVGNCTKGEGSSEAEISETAHIMVGGISIAYSTAVVIIVIVALIVGVSVLGLGMLIWKWPRRSPRNRRNGCPTNAASKPSTDVYDSVKQTVYEVEPTADQLDTYLQTHRNLKIERYACSHMWDVPVHDGCDLVCDYAMRRNQMLATYNGGTSEAGDNRGTEVVVTTVDSYPRTLPRCQTPEGVLDPPRYFELEAQAL